MTCMARLISTWLIPCARSKGGIDPPTTHIDQERFSSDGDALDKAAGLLWNEAQRQRKTPRKGRVLVRLQIERDDGTIRLIAVLCG